MLNFLKNTSQNKLVISGHVMTKSDWFTMLLEMYAMKMSSYQAIVSGVILDISSVYNEG